MTLDWNTLANCREVLSPSNINGLYVVTGEDQLQLEEIRHAQNMASYVTSLPALSRLYIGVRGIMRRNPLNISEPSPEVSALLSRPGECRRLRSLTFFGVFLIGVPPAIRGLKQLESLSFHGGLRRLQNGYPGCPITRSNG